MKHIWFWLLIFAGTAAHAGTTTVLVPQNWHPDLDVQTIDEWSTAALKDASGNIPQQGLNRYMSLLADVWDSKLMLAYIQLSASLGPKEKERLTKEQQAWLAKREAESQKAGDSEAGGSDAPATYSRTYIDLTQKRYKAITARLSPPSQK